MICGYLPFEDPDTNTLYSKILSGKYSVHRTVSSQARDLLEKILSNDENKRYTIDQIRKHPWMSNTRSASKISPGIVVGLHKIPIDQKIVESLREFKFDPDYVSKCLEANRHNNSTTAYYLALKKYVREGGASSCDLSSKEFDRTLLEPPKKKTVNGGKILMDNFMSRTT